MRFRRTAIAFACLSLAACQTSATDARADARAGEVASAAPDSWRYDHATPLLVMVNRFARESGTSFVFDDDVERDLDRFRIEWISCFTNEPSDPKLNDLDELKQLFWRAESKGDVSLEIQAVGPASSNTYVIRRRVFCPGTPDPFHRGV